VSALTRLCTFFAVVTALLFTTGSARAEPRTVKLWHAYTGAEEQGLKRALVAFHQAHPDVQVDVLAVAFGAYRSKLESAIPTGHGPDVFIDAHERLPNYVQAGLMQSRGPLAELDAAGDFEPAHVQALSVDGQIYGLPLSVKCAALYINDDLLPTAPASFEAIEASRADLPEGVWPLVMEAESAYYLAAFAHAFGARALDDEGQFMMVGPEAERAVDFVRGLVERKVVPEEPTGELVKRMFSSGKAATAVSGPWLAPDLPETLRYHVVPLPVVETAGGALAVPFATVEGAYLAKGGGDEAAARLLVTFLAGPGGARPRARVGRQIVASREAWRDPKLADDSFLRTFRDAAARAVPMPSHPNMSLTFEPLEKALKKVIRSGVPAGPALSEAQSRFADVIRPPPPRKSPTFALVFLGLLFVGAAAWLVYRVRDPDMQAALRRSVPAYKWVAHAFLAVGLLVIAPLAVGAATSLFAGRGTDLHYVGLANYVDIITARGGPLLASGSFWLVLLVTLLWTTLNLVLHVSIGLCLALLLNRPKLRMRAGYRVLLILPWAVPNYVTALAWKGMFHRQMGAMNTILEALGAEPVSWFGHWSTAFAANLSTNVWLGFPFMMVVTLGALSAIPKELYEAAAVDGASAWQRFKLITYPMLKVTLAPAMAMGAVWTFNMFNVVFLVSGGEPDGGTEILVSEAYRWAFTRSQQYGYAAAYAVLIFGVLLVFTRGFAKRLADPGGLKA